MPKKKSAPEGKERVTLFGSPAEAKRFQKTFGGRLEKKK